MKKLILTMVLFLSTVLGVSAQTAIETPKLTDNVYVGVQGGVSTPLDFNSVFPFNGLAGIKIGKDFTPVWGMNIDGDAIFGDNHYMSGKTFVKTTYIGVNGTLNLTNLLRDYNANRVFTVSTEVGLGWLHDYNSQSIDGKSEVNNLGAKTGLVFAWNLGKAKAWQIYANPTVYWNLSRTGKIQFNNNHAQLAVLAGLVYKFKTSNGTHNFKVWNVGEMNDEINKLRAENEELKNRPAKVVEKIVPAAATETNTTNAAATVQTTYIVAFANNDATLNDAAKAVLNQISENSTVVVDGYADGVGSEAYNQTLSETRANNVSDYLTKRNVKVVSASGHGQTGAYAARIVIITNK